MRRVSLSAPLPIIVLVGRYPTNKLIGRRLILEWQARRSLPFLPSSCELVSLSGISIPFGMLSQFRGQITYVFLSLLPLDTYISYET